MAIFLITGASGSGKTTIAQEMQKLGYWDECISHTTRDMREGEVDGKTYYFINRPKFEDMLSNGEFAENVTYDGNCYGITKKEIERVMRDNHKDVFVIVEYDGYLQMKEHYPDAIGIFLYMSKEDCLANMLLRGDSIDKALKRIERYDDEMKNRNEYDYVIKNVRNRQNQTINVIVNIIMQYS